MAEGNPQMELRYYESGCCVGTAIPFCSETNPWWGLTWHKDWA